jgi:Pyruvate/2-oxoacid:ferredoxin oxidoreductase gamma subunit
LVNSSLLDSESLNSLTCKKSSDNVYPKPFTETALKLGNIKVANTVALGFYLAKKKILQKETVLKVIREIAPAKSRHLIAINVRAIEEGIKL